MFNDIAGVGALFPTGSQTTTRTPIRLQLHDDVAAGAEPYALVYVGGTRPGSRTRVPAAGDNVPNAIRDCADTLVANRPGGFCDTEVVVELHKHGVPLLTLIDLPGLVQGHADDEVIAAVQDMVRRCKDCQVNMTSRNTPLATPQNKLGTLSLQLARVEPGTSILNRAPTQAATTHACHRLRRTARTAATRHHCRLTRPRFRCGRSLADSQGKNAVVVVVSEAGTEKMNEPSYKFIGDSEGSGCWVNVHTKLDCLTGKIRSPRVRNRFWRFHHFGLFVHHAFVGFTPLSITPLSAPRLFFGC